MKRIQLFNVAPRVPKEISFLETLSRNMWWCWNPDAIELFRRVNPLLWRETGHNPLVFLSSVPQKRLENLPHDDGFMSHLNRVRERFEATVLPYVDNDESNRAARCIAYFSLEYGIHESIRLYSGGLGMLAGDHLKSASDLNVPLVAVGLLYRQGYFQQFLNNDGWQQESYPENEIHHLPLVKACDRENRHVTVAIPFPEGPVKACVWRLDIGRISLYLLDPNVPENPPEFRRLAAQLYGGDRKTRLRQELLLGIGGFRALIELGYDPLICHMNEGHAAFVSLQRLNYLIKTKRIDKQRALEIIPRTSIFTTHTPVPAGNETFDLDMLRPHLEALKPELGLDPDEIISWAQAGDGHGPHEISMTILGLRMAHYSNGVSQLHGKVARKMWLNLWPGKPEDEIPITHVTNGIHVSSWLSPDYAGLFDRYLGPEWRETPGEEDNLAHIAQIPDEELWRAHEVGKSRLIRTAREHLENSLVHRNATRTEISQAKAVLDHDTLTIGFARRFATYKRAILLMKDPKRLEALLTNEERPVQLVFAGKAHPADDHGKDFIRQIVHFARKPNLARKVVFLENYDTYIARSLVQGVDVWLNTPRRPQEASGTSGMKAAVNGVPHVSILDGWWCEGYSRECGWAIGHGEAYDDHEYQDAVESQALYNILENEVIPCYYERQTGDIPARWVKMMKASIRMALGYFTSHRMVSEYESLFYGPAISEYESLVANNAERAGKLVEQYKRLKSLWHKVAIRLPTADKDVSNLHVGDTFNVTTTVDLGELRHDEVEVQVYHGPVNSENQILESNANEMAMVEHRGGGAYVYRHEITCKMSGRYGFTTRVTPAGKDWKATMPGFLTWADGSLQ